MPAQGVVDLSVQIASLRLSNPIIAASGTFGYGIEFAHLVRPKSARRNCDEGPFAGAHGGRPRSPAL